MNLTNWTARRAGGRITINGVCAETGKPKKLVGVDEINPRLVPKDGTDRDRIIAFATDKNGDTHGLLGVA